MLLLCYRQRIGWEEWISKVYVSKVLHMRYRFRRIFVSSFYWEGSVGRGFLPGESDLLPREMDDIGFLTDLLLAIPGDLLDGFGVSGDFYLTCLGLVFLIMYS